MSARCSARAWATALLFRGVCASLLLSPLIWPSPGQQGVPLTNYPSYDCAHCPSYLRKPFTILTAASQLRMPSNEHLYAPAGPASAAKSDPRSDSSPSAAIDNHATTAPAGQASPRLTDTLSSSTTAVPAGVRPMRVEGVRRRSLTFLSRFSRRFSGRQESASSLYGQAPCVGDLSRVDTDFILREQSDRVIRELRDLTTSHREQTG
ncbi:hypothetical protein BD626DRAFT_580514, partial [Schizophyllum amplum]